MSLQFEHKTDTTAPGLSDREHQGLGSVQPHDPIEALRRQRAANVQGRNRDFVVPGFEHVPFGKDEDGDELYGQLIGRYERLPVDDFRAAVAACAPNHSPEDRLAGNAQFLIDALAGEQGTLYWRVDGQRIDLIPGERAGWHDLAQRIAPDLPDTTSAVVLLIDGVFAGNTIALADHALEVARWMEEGHAAADRDAAGGF